jgi:hypothetical protein
VFGRWRTVSHAVRRFEPRHSLRRWCFRRRRRWAMSGESADDGDCMLASQRHALQFISATELRVLCGRRRFRVRQRNVARARRSERRRNRTGRMSGHGARGRNRMRNEWALLRCAPSMQLRLRDRQRNAVDGELPVRRVGRPAKWRAVLRRQRSRRCWRRRRRGVTNSSCMCRLRQSITKCRKISRPCA